MAIKYISYDYFEELVSRKSKIKRRVKYNKIEYAFWYEKGKYCFQQCLPNNINIQRFDTYPLMIRNIRIEGECIQDLWDKQGFEYVYQIVKNRLKDGQFNIYYYFKQYKQYKELYKNTMMSAQKICIINNTDNIKLNKQYFVNLWDFNLFKLAIGLLIGFGGFALIFLNYKLNGQISNDLIMQNFFTGFFVLFILTHVFIFIGISFFAPLLTDAPNKINSYYYGNRVLYLFALVEIIIGGCWSLRIFWACVLGDFMALVYGYVAYKIYYNRKLKEAEKIREEYRREHSEENIG